MELRIKMTLDNSAFCGDDPENRNAEEVKRILTKLCRDNGNFRKEDGGKLRDWNGNAVGQWEVV